MQTPGPAGRGQENVPAGTVRIRERSQIIIHRHLTRLTTWAAFENTRTSRARLRRCSSGHYKDTKGYGATSILDTVNNLGILYADQGKVGQDGEDVSASEDMGSSSHDQHPGQPLGPLRRPGQAEQGRQDIPTNNTRIQEDS